MYCHPLYSLRKLNICQLPTILRQNEDGRRTQESINGILMLAMKKLVIGDPTEKL